MTLQRKSDGERLAVAETRIEFLTRGDEQLTQQIEEVREEFNARLDITNEKLDMVIARLDAQSNELKGASKLAVVLWKAFPWICGMLAAFGVGRVDWP